jgi:hypothetical protein
MLMDPSGYYPWQDCEPPTDPYFTYSEEDGLCVKYFGCSGGKSYREWYVNEYLPVLEQDIASFVGSQWTCTVINFGVDTYQEWTGFKVPARVGFGIDAGLQLL